MAYVDIDTLYEEEGKEKVELKEDYISVEETAIVEMTVKKSRFIGLAFHVETDTQVHDIVANLRKSNKNAKHVCYAYILGEKPTTAKNSDDGEPAGSAGAPIFEAIRHFHLTNTLVVVVRYFGGIELGKSRLTRVYNAVAAGALAEAKKFKMVYCNEFEIKVSYQNYGAVSKLFSESSVHIIEQTNDESMPILKIAVPINASDKVINSVREKTRGAGIINKYGMNFYKFPHVITNAE